MKLNKRVHKKLVNNLKKWRDRLVKQIDFDLQAIEETSSLEVEHIMKLKSEMLVKILSNFCLGHEECYFCLLHSNQDNGQEPKCKLCVYGSYNGICLSKESIYQSIRRAVSEVKRILLHHYCKFS